MTQPANHKSPLEPSYSVIIPTLNEVGHIRNAIASVKNQRPEVEIIVVDGGSDDGTAPMASDLGARAIHANRGRGTQCNAGARLASGEMLLFLHADTTLPAGAFKLLGEYFSEPRIKIGSFRLRFDRPHWLLRFYAAFTRFDSIFTRFGDQCLVVRRSFLEEIGGFPEWPLFEDVHLLRRARRRTKVYSFPAHVTTSARRFLRKGLIRGQLINAWLLVQYLLGVSPERLALQYESDRLFEKSFLRLLSHIVFQTMGVLRRRIRMIWYGLQEL